MTTLKTWLKVYEVSRKYTKYFMKYFTPKISWNFTSLNICSCSVLYKHQAVVILTSLSFSANHFCKGVNILTTWLRFGGSFVFFYYTAGKFTIFLFPVFFLVVSCIFLLLTWSCAWLNDVITVSRDMHPKGITFTICFKLIRSSFTYLWPLLC